MIWDKSSITFLDVIIHKDEKGSLSSSLYRKPTAGNSILHASSFYPQALILSIPYSQYLRIRRNCSDTEVLKREADLLKVRLMAQSYSNTCLKKAFNRACTRTRSVLLYNPSSKTSKKNPISIITKFSNQHNKNKCIVEKYWHVLTLDTNIGPFVPDTPSFTFRRARSLRDQLVSSEFKADGRKDPCKHGGTFTCGGCNYCRFLNTSKNILLPNSERYKPRHYANCQMPGWYISSFVKVHAFTWARLYKSFGKEPIVTLLL